MKMATNSTDSREKHLQEAKIVRQMIEEHAWKLTARQERYLKIKRIFDAVAAFIGLVVLLIPFLIIAVLQKISSPHEPVFFLQKRVGKDGHCFHIIKFRTMKTTAPKNVATGELENAEAYISRLGGWLRRLSLDELPQLINVLKGDMSLVGPRPLVYTESEIRYLRRYYGIYAVRPGITGWAQVNGRDTVDMIDKVAYDRVYVRNVCLRFDCLILLRTVWCVLLQTGIVEGKQKTPKFAEQIENVVQQDFDEKTQEEPKEFANV